MMRPLRTCFAIVVGATPTAASIVCPKDGSESAAAMSPPLAMPLPVFESIESAP